MTFGEKLAEARKEKGLSQEELAQQIFVTRQALCNCYVTKLWNFHEAGKLFMMIGEIMWIFASVLLSVFHSINTSVRYNLWLMKTHSIVRTNKFYSVS